MLTALNRSLFSPYYISSFPTSSDGKASTCNAEDPGVIPGLGRFPGEGDGNPF